MMARRTRLSILTAALAVATAAAAAAALAAGPATAPTRSDYAARYGSLSDHNIFLRERGKAAPNRSSRNSGGGSFTRRNPVDTTFVLTGIVQEEDGEYFAYVEDGQRSRLLRLTVGDAVARGRLDAIDFGAVTYTADGQQTIVALGQNFNGAAPAAAGPTTTASATNPSPEEEGPATAAIAAPSTPAALPPNLPFDPNDPNLTAEQKMKLKRLMGK